MISRSGLRIVAATLAVAGAATGCGGKLPPAPASNADLPNIRQIETAITASVLARDRFHVRVLCPALVPQITGETFSCIGVATKPVPRTLTFLVTEHGGTAVTYQQTG